MTKVRADVRWRMSPETFSLENFPCEYCFMRGGEGRGGEGRGGEGKGGRGWEGCLCFVFLWLFPSCRVAGMTDDLSSPHRPVRLLARSQSSTFQISLKRVFLSSVSSSSLPFPWYICPQHFPQYVFAISPHHLPVPDQSSLGDLFGSLRHYCCSSDVFIPDLVFSCHSARPS